MKFLKFSILFFVATGFFQDGFTKNSVKNSDRKPAAIPESGPEFVEASCWTLVRKGQKKSTDSNQDIRLGKVRGDDRNTSEVTIGKNQDLLVTAKRGVNLGKELIVEVSVPRDARCINSFNYEKALSVNSVESDCYTRVAFASGGSNRVSLGMDISGQHVQVNCEIK